MPNKIKYIFIHCSDSNFGNNLLIDSWHKDRGWSGIGYHFVLLNGCVHTSKDYWAVMDGQIQTGRPLDRDPDIEKNEVGAQVENYNQNSIGICLIGTTEFTKKQMESLKILVTDLLSFTGLTINFVLGHCESNTAHGKTCPNIRMDLLRKYLAGSIPTSMIPNVK